MRADPPVDPHEGRRQLDELTGDDLRATPAWWFPGADLHLSGPDAATVLPVDTSGAAADGTVEFPEGRFLLHAVFTPAQSGIAFDNETVIAKRAHVSQARQVCGHLAADSIGQLFICGFEDGPACSCVNGIDDLQTQSSNRQARETAMRFAAASHRHRPPQARRPCRAFADDVQAGAR